MVISSSCEPCSSTLPRYTAAILSAERIVLRRCATMMEVRPICKGDSDSCQQLSQNNHQSSPIALACFPYRSVQGPAHHELVECILNALLRLGIQSRGRLVKKQNLPAAGSMRIESSERSPQKRTAHSAPHTVLYPTPSHQPADPAYAPLGLEGSPWR